MKLYVNNYPINDGCDNYGNRKLIDQGTVFRIEAINGDGFDLKPLNKVGDFDTYWVGAKVFEKAFRETEYVGAPGRSGKGVERAELEQNNEGDTVTV